MIPVFMTTTQIEFLITALDHSVNEGKMPPPVTIFVGALLDQLKQARKVHVEVIAETAKEGEKKGGTP